MSTLASLDLRTAQLAVQAALAQVSSFAPTLSLKSHTHTHTHVLEMLAERTRAAADALAQLQTEGSTAEDGTGTSRMVPRDVALSLLARALSALSDALSHTHTLTAAGSQTVVLQAYAAAVETATGIITSMRDRVNAGVTEARDKVVQGASGVVSAVNATASPMITAAQADVAERVAGLRARIVAAQEALQALYTRMQSPSEGRSSDGEYAFLAPGRELVHTASLEVTRSLATLADAPMNEKVIVAANESLHLARLAVTSVASLVEARIATSPLGAVRDGVLSRVETARAAAAAAVAAAISYIASLRATVAGPAVEMAKGVADHGVNLAVQQAAALDVTYHVTERLAALDAGYGVTERAVKLTQDLQALAVSLDGKYHLSDKALAALAAARELDARYTAGRGTEIAARAQEVSVELAEHSLEYAKDVQAKFLAARAALEAPAVRDASDASTTADATPHAASAAAPAPARQSENDGSAASAPLAGVASSVSDLRTETEASAPKPSEEGGSAFSSWTASSVKQAEGASEAMPTTDAAAKPDADGGEASAAEPVDAPAATADAPDGKAGDAHTHTHAKHQGQGGKRGKGRH